MAKLDHRLARIGAIWILLVTCQFAHAQLILKDSAFPRPGDSLTFIRDYVEPDTRFTEGENQVWDFRYLESPLYLTKKFEPSPFSPKYSQPGNSSSYGEGSQIQLYERRKDALCETGFLLMLSGNRTKGLPVFYDQEICIRPPDLSMGRKSRHRVQFEFELERRELPVSLQSDLPAGTRRIRVSGTKTITRQTDAWGSLLLPGEVWKANRIKVSERTAIRFFDAGTGKSLPYFDEKMTGQVYPFPLFRQYYEFWTGEHLFAAARIHMEPGTGKMRSIEYQARPYGSDKIDLKARRNDFILYPNPTYNVAKIYISVENPGTYALAIYNIIGKKLWQEEIELQGTGILKENFGFLPKGTYLLSLLDENGNILRTIRLMIVSV